MKRLALVFLILLILFFLLTGRMTWVLLTLPVLLPWLLRARAFARTFKNFARVSAGLSGQPSGQSSALETRFLRMSLDHDTGEIDGEILEGLNTGRRLSTFGVEELIQLMAAYQREDMDSARILEAYLDRVHEGWRDTPGGSSWENGDRGGFTEGSMTKEEAYRILGLEPGAPDDEIKRAYHRLMAALHPDHGGSDYLAAKINQAKQVLLGE